MVHAGNMLFWQCRLSKYISCGYRRWFSGRSGCGLYSTATWLSHTYFSHHKSYSEIVSTNMSLLIIVSIKALCILFFMYCQKTFVISFHIPVDFHGICKMFIKYVAKFVMYNIHKSYLYVTKKRKVQTLDITHKYCYKKIIRLHWKIKKNKYFWHKRFIVQYNIFYFFFVTSVT